MSKYFVLAEDDIGPGGQVYFKKHKGAERWYRVFLDESCIGMVMYSGSRARRKWTGLSDAPDSEFFRTRMLEGFATRWDAAVFVFKHNGYWMHTERELEHDMKTFKKGVDENQGI